jgi:hypothetical protein
MYYGIFEKTLSCQIIRFFFFSFIPVIVEISLCTIASVYLLVFFSFCLLFYLRENWKQRMRMLFSILSFLFVQLLMMMMMINKKTTENDHEINTRQEFIIGIDLRRCINKLYITKCFAL